MHASVHNIPALRERPNRPVAVSGSGQSWLGQVRDAPRMGALPTAKIEEAVHARGDVDVRARALLAGRHGLSMDSAPNGSTLGGAMMCWGKHIITPYS